MAKERSVAGKGWAYARAIAVTGTIWTWGFSLWIPQLVLASFSVVGLGLFAAYSGSVLDKIINTISEAVLGVTIDGSFLFVTAWMLVLAIGWTTLAIAILQYTMALLHPLSGKHALLKYAFLMTAMIGYAIPLANFLPWFALFTFIVVRYPK